MNFNQAVTTLSQNPSLFFRKAMGKTRTLLSSEEATRIISIDGVKFECDFLLSPMVRAMSIGFYELEITDLMRRILKKGDTFLDVGANIGYMSAFALSLVGTKGHVYSFEPVPKYFKRLLAIGLLNPDYKIVCNQMAMGETKGEANIDVCDESNIGWNTMLPGAMAAETLSQSITVPVGTLSSYITENNLQDLKLIKIDTEGYEFPILKGVKDLFETNPSFRPKILCEVAPSAGDYLGFTGKDFSEFMKQFGYESYSTLNASIIIDLKNLKTTTNVLFSTVRLS